MQSSNAPLKISLADIETYKQSISKFLDEVQVTVDERRGTVGYAGRSGTRSRIKTNKILERAHEVSGEDDVLLHDMVNHTLQVVLRGLQIGTHLSELYNKSSGLDSLKQSQKSSNGFKSDSERAEFNEKNATLAHILRFVSAHYITWELTGYRSDVVDSAKVSFGELEGISYTNRSETITTLLFQYCEALKGQDVVSPEALVRMTLEFFRAVRDDVVNRVDAGSVEYHQPFSERSYKLEDSEFSVNGFTVEVREVDSGVEFNRLDFKEIVGNTEAKHQARRAAFRLLCYDFETQQNPFMELVGTNQRIRLGYGVPGTGKSMLIAAIATYLHDLCDMVGVPFVFHPLPDGIVSSFQGTTATNMEKYMKTFLDPTKIIYGAIDDAENLFEDRTRQGVSEGAKSVIGVFLRYTEGAYALDYGNNLIDFMTNLADVFDPAVLSRIQSRFPINGARRVVDFEDQDSLWHPQFEKIDADFINMKHSDGYEFLAEQRQLSSLGEALEDVTEPQNGRMKDIFRKVVKNHDINSHSFFAQLYYDVQQMFDSFSSREVRNIQTAVSSRIVDFDPESIWMEDPETFFRKDYDTKLAMLREKMIDNMQGLSFPEVRLQEVCKYLDTFAEIADTARERRISDRVEQLQEEYEARSRADVK